MKGEEGYIGLPGLVGIKGDPGFDGIPGIVGLKGERVRAGVD